MLLDLVLYPNPVLKAVAEPVEKFDEALEQLVADMAETMYEGKGVGLAAPQIGRSIRVFVVDTSAPDEPHALKAYINPKIILKDDPCVWNEGCLSVPGIYRDVKTFAHVIIEAQDVKGEWFREEARELQAVALLHEYAHLEGSVFIDRLNPVKRNMTKKFWVKRGKALAEETYKDTKLKYVFDEQAIK